MDLALVSYIQLSDVFRLAAKYLYRAAEQIEKDAITQAGKPKMPMEEIPVIEKTKEKKKEKTKEKVKEKAKIKAPRKKTGYQLFFEESMARLKKGDDGKSKKYLEIMVPELSTIISKDWKALGESGQTIWNDKAEEINIITQGFEGFPQKPQKPKKIDPKSSSSELSDTESDGMPRKKIKSH